MDLTIQPPRSAYCTAVAGLMGAARATDKARAQLNGTMGEYRFGSTSGLDGRTLGFLGLSPDEFLDAVKACPDDRSLTASLQEKMGKIVEKIKACNESQRNRTPQDEEGRQHFEQRKQSIGRSDIKMVSDMLDAEDVHEFGPPTDLTSQPPRSAHSGSLLGIACLARMADKGRAKLAGKIGEYKYGEDSGLDENTLGFIELTADELLEGVRQSPDDGALARWLLERVHKSDQEIAEWNTERRARGPWNDEIQKMFNRRTNAVGRPDLTTFLDLLDAEDAHDFPC